ncbi:MAG: hypothetical protein U5K71_11195 [Gracilimonas sp.]|nr:hypothetical protein [Gracilimonas sp.]
MRIKITITRIPSVLVVPITGFLLFLGIIFLFLDYPPISDDYASTTFFEDYYLLLIPIVFGLLYFEVINSYVRARLHSVPGSVISEIILRLITIVLLVLFWYDWITFGHFMVGFACSYIIQPLLLLLFLFMKGELFLKPNFAYLKTTLVKRMANYGLFAVLGGMTTLVVNNIDIIMLGSLAGLTVNRSVCHCFLYWQCDHSPSEISWKDRSFSGSQASEG